MRVVFLRLFVAINYRSFGPILSAQSQSFAAGSALTSEGSLTVGLEISCARDGYLRFFTGWILTAFPLRADLKIASITRISARPSSPEGSGWRSWRTQSEK